ncbi:hypothetical protein E5345_03510 [Propionibacterium sp. NM47_B9-13]|uniref:Uncharacterized protein n=1 Tax=Cutibacterium modestum HL044PA1 TaxID=765109 RepID=A0ABN0C2L5_9ACTN|nr:hypothetical protein HMPREF9621_00130 [Cutibacterium modestum HL037PA2]EFS91379.1 hypothetical protein HMPREF9607_02672 [Cutibacterium modestum HL044PA1]REB75504.1 hypothetical protein CP877_01655 [Cutibacterium modestum]TGY29604.1 hypothetical protein E5345_03510 [Propionibacterium sp. NM47_B9-13]
MRALRRTPRPQTPAPRTSTGPPHQPREPAYAETLPTQHIPDLVTSAVPDTSDTVRRILAARPDRALFRLEDVLAQVGCATVTSTTRIIVETTTGETINIPLTRGWTPSRHY